MFGRNNFERHDEPSNILTRYSIVRSTLARSCVRRTGESRTVPSTLAYYTVFYLRNLNSHCAERLPAEWPFLRSPVGAAAMPQNHGNRQPGCPSPVFCRTEVQEKIVRLETYSPGNYKTWYKRTPGNISLQNEEPVTTRVDCWTCVTP